MTRGPSLQTLINRLVALNPQRDLHIETLQGSGWRVSCCNEEDTWIGWIEGRTLIEVVRKALDAMEANRAG